MSIQFQKPRGIKPFLFHAIEIFLCAAVVLSACAPAPTEPPTSTPVVIDLNQLYANSWVLVGYGDPNNPTVIQPGLTLTAQFAPDGSMGGFGGCNNFSGAYTAGTDGTLSIGPLATTRMACAEGMEEETAYLTALQGAKSLSFTSEGRLAIKYDAGGAIDQAMTFSIAALPLTETNWVLVSMGDPAAQQEIPAGVVITANFSTDGYLSGTTSCNQYNTTYTLQNDQITVGPVASTMMACPSGMDTEQAYLQALSSAQQVAISGPKLTITYNQGAGLLTYTSASLPLTYTVWTLSVMNGQPAPPESNVTAMFTPSADSPDTGTISGYSGCNNYNAGYSASGTSLTVQPAALTMMACPEGMDLESSYLETLQQSTSYQIFADKLVLSGPSGTMTYTANRTPLTGALWMLIALGDVNAPEIPVTGSRFAAQFSRTPGAPSGVMTGTTGCNEYSAAYTASVHEIKINLPMSSDNKSCPPGLADQEELFFLALNNATTYTISGNTLILPYDDGKQALVFEGTQVDSAERPVLSDLNGSLWYLWYMNVSPVVSGTTIYGQFSINADGTSGTFSGSAGCNNYVATFGNNLGVQTSLNATQHCNQPAGVMEQESGYLQMLSRAFGYWQTGDQLIINSGLGVLTYRNTPAPAANDQTHLLVGPTWFLVSYKDSSSSAGTQEPYTQFNSNGTLNGFTGCNTFQGNFSTSVQNITITNLNSTKSACPNNALTNQEQAMLDILGSAKDYQVVDTVMQIVGTAGVLNYSLSPLHRPQEVQPPVASFTYTPNVPAGQVVTFDGTGSTGQVPIVKWEWNFGDKQVGSGSTISHVYSTPGTYRVSLKVTDQRGNQNVQEQTYDSITPIQPTPAPTQTPPPTPTTAPDQPTPTPAPTQPPLPTEEPPVVAPLPVIPPQAAIQGPQTGYVGEPITFDASGSTSGSTPIVTYSFIYGDGTSSQASNSPQATTIYNQTGTYTVSVIVTDQNGLSSEASMSVSISSRLGTPIVWKLDSLNGQQLVPGTAITLQFLNGQIAGFSGCNSYTGGYTATQNEDSSYSVTINGLVGTGAACPANIMTMEQTYLSILGSVNLAQGSGNVLTLTSPQGTLTYHQ